MFDRFAAVLVMKVNHIAGCQPQLDFDETDLRFLHPSVMVRKSVLPASGPNP